MITTFIKALLAIAATALATSVLAHDTVSVIGCKADQAGVAQVVEAASPYLARATRARSTIHTEGTARYDMGRLSSVWAKSDWAGMRLLAVAWRLTGRTEYLDKVDELLVSWISVYQLSFNPIDESDMEALIDAYTETAQALPDETRTKVVGFLLSMGRGYAARMHEMEGERGNWVNNWQSHRIKLLTMTAFATGDPVLTSSARSLYAKHLRRNISDHGPPIDFSERDSIGYAVYSLTPMLKAAVVAKANGEDWFSHSGLGAGRLQRSMAWLDEYSQGRRKHREFVNSRIRSDASRNRHRVGIEWKPSNALHAYWLAAYLDPEYRNLARSLGPAPVWMTACSH